MSKQAEEAALKAYPRTMVIVNDSYGNPVPYDGASVQREIFIGGYKQAEKDLALTVDDIKSIHHLLRELAWDEDTIIPGVTKHFHTMEEYHKAVLDRFNELKADKK